MAQGWARGWWVTRAPAPGPLKARPPTRMDTRFPLCPAAAAHLVCLVILARAPSRARSHGTHGKSPALADRSSPAVHGNISRSHPVIVRFFARRYSALRYCRHDTNKHANRPSPGRQIPGMACTSVNPTPGRGWDWAGHPTISSKATTRCPGGAPTRTAGSSVTCCPGAARGWAAPDRRDAMSPAAARRDDRRSIAVQGQVLTGLPQMLGTRPTESAR